MCMCETDRNARGAHRGQKDRDICIISVTLSCESVFVIPSVRRVAVDVLKGV